MMRRLGKVLHISHRGSIIVRTDKPPSIGAEVVDKKLNTVGIIVDVFGPVKTPYVSIHPTLDSKEQEKGKNKSAKSFTKLVGQILYIYKRKSPRST